MEYAAPEEMQTLITAAEQHEQYEIPEVTERYPIIDASRPFVCQKCGVSFAREKALLSHSKVSSIDFFSANSCKIPPPDAQWRFTV